MFWGKWDMTTPFSKPEPEVTSVVPAPAAPVVSGGGAPLYPPVCGRADVGRARDVEVGSDDGLEEPVRARASAATN